MVSVTLHRFPHLPVWVLPVSFLLGIRLPRYKGNYVSPGLCILFPLGHWHLEFSEGLASPSAGVLKEQMVIGPIQGACEERAE